jgi:DNA mismatch endonuclease, patch repair protein
VSERRTRKESGRKAGHRRWAARNGRVPGEHRGDIMSREARSLLMSRINGKNTSPERSMFSELRLRRIYFATHAKDLPGCPDIVFRRIKLAVFIDGDFWHGWRFPLWEHKLSEKWRDKIASTRNRDQRNFRKLRRMGWTVIRIWEHQIETDVESCIERVLDARKELSQVEKNMSGGKRQ